MNSNFFNVLMLVVVDSEYFLYFYGNGSIVNVKVKLNK